MAAASKGALALLLCACASSTAPAPAKITVLPEPLVLSQPKLTQLIQNRVTVIDLWATWCEPCVEALPKLNRLSKAYGPKGLVVVGVSVGEEPARVSRFQQTHAIEYPLYVDPDFRFADSMATRSVPTLLVFDAQGQLQRTASGLDADALALIESLLKP